MTAFWTWLITWITNIFLAKKKPAEKPVTVNVSQHVGSRSVLIGGTVDDNQVKYNEFLTQACENRVSCRIVGLARGELAKGKFIGLDHNRVEIELQSGNGITLTLDSFRLLSAYLVSFFYNSKQMMFSGLAINMDSDKLILEMTSDVSAGNVRRGFRVSVRKDDGLSIRVKIGSQEITPIPLDISFSGIMFEVSPGIELSLDQMIVVIMSLNGYTACLNGEVRRKDGNRYGVFFPETPFSSGKDAVALRKIVKTVELYRLNQNEGANLD